MNLKALGFAALCGLVIGALLFRCRTDPYAEARADSLATARRHLVASEVARTRNDSLARDSIAKLQQRVSENGAKAAALSRRADQLTADLRSVLGGVRGADLDTLLAAKDSVIALKTSQVADLTVSLTLAEARWQAADSSAFQWRTLQAGTALQLRDALRAGRGPRCIVGPGASVGIHGYAAGLSVTCHV